MQGSHVFHPSQGISGMDHFNKDDNDLPVSTQTAEEIPNKDVLYYQTIPSTPSQSSRKHECATSETPIPTRKAKITSADAIQSLTTSISHFGNNICKVLAGDPSEKTPKCHTKAVKLAQKESWLPMADHLILCNVFKKDIKAADAYTALDAEDVKFHQMWIQEKVEEAKVLRAIV